VGLYEAQELFQNQTQGFLDLEDTGLHLIGFTRQGDIFLDNSGQTKPGMNISDVLDLEGEPVLSLFLDAAAAENGEVVHLTGVWPHPVSHRVGPMSVWCDRLTQKEVICALAWDHNEGNAE
jgi:hypothetical protein